jgi:tungstate transport system substrate-binding protein
MRRRGATLLAILAVACSGEPDRPDLVVATTTSVRDSGLLDALMPELTRQTGLEPKLVAVGTGAALRMAREGNCDALITHAPDAERALLDEGVLVSRTPFMRNWFVIAGPPDDPAGIRDLPATEALARLQREGATWVSRDDDSGTHRRERALMRAAGIDPQTGWSGIIRTGTGMGASLQVAGERRAYILADIATHLAFAPRTGLVVLSRREESLVNEYSVLRVASSPHPEATRAFEAFWRDPGVLEAVGRFGVERHGEPLFEPLPAP